MPVLVRCTGIDPASWGLESRDHPSGPATYIKYYNRRYIASEHYAGPANYYPLLPFAMRGTLGGVVILAKVQRIELYSQGFGDLRITIFLHQRILLLAVEHTFSQLARPMSLFDFGKYQRNLELARGSIPT